MAEAPGDLSRAVVTRWLLGNDDPYAVHAVTRNIPHSVKRPLESRIWYRYPNQTSAASATEGEQPAQIARVLDDGTTQLTQFTYNTGGMVTSRTDPVGRQTTYTYDTNGIDMLQVRQTKPGGSDLLATYGGYTTEHQPTTVNDAAGQTTATTYNVAGQPLTVTNAKNETTTYAYEGTTGHLTSVTGPVASAITSYTYDDLGRVHTITDADGYTVTDDYDALNRLTRRTYPDGTFRSVSYDRLDIAEARDRRGRVFKYFYDRLGRRTGTRDPLGRIERQEWCGCGSIEALIDANGNRTSWQFDARGRVISENRADSTSTTYSYDATGRLRTITDPKGQVATHTYLADDRLASTSYTNAVVSTPSISYTYDALYPRIVTMVDGSGTTTYTYKSSTQLGATQIASIDGPLDNDTIAFTYDELGRATSRTVNNNATNWAFDALERVTSEINSLGTFVYTYDGTSKRLASVTYPNVQTSLYTYMTVAQDLRLETIHHKYSNGSTLSRSDYISDLSGNVQSWTQQFDSAAPQKWLYSYDAVDQLVQAVHETTDPIPTVLNRYTYAYDPAGNRTSAQLDDVVATTSYDHLNRPVGKAPGGPLTFAGSVSEAANVTIQGHPVIVDHGNAFRGNALTTSGTNTATIIATDASGNVASQNYQVDVSASTNVLASDADGNLASDGLRTFEWDARNQLVAINAGSHRTEFTYDGLKRRVRQLERENGLVIADSYFVWDDSEIVERRDASGAVTIRYHHDSYEENGAARYTFADHLRSVTDITTDTGTLYARYPYDPYGTMTKTTGQGEDVLGFSGVPWHQASALLLMEYRAYDPSFGRWLSEDPLRLAAGPNMFTYVRNQPLKWIDTQGLSAGLAGMLPGRHPAGKQDGVCSFPASVLTGECNRAACQRHDACYVSSECGMASWLTAFDKVPVDGCDICNQTVAVEVSRCLLCELIAHWPTDPSPMLQ